MRVDVDSQLNTEYENKNKSGQFMTLFYLTVDQDSGCLEWVRAGHDPGIFYDPEKGLFEDLAGPGLALGINSEWIYVTNRKEGLKQGQIILFQKI